MHFSYDNVSIQSLTRNTRHTETEVADTSEMSIQGESRCKRCRAVSSSDEQQSHECPFPSA